MKIAMFLRAKRSLACARRSCTRHDLRVGRAHCDTRRHRHRSLAGAAARGSSRICGAAPSVRNRGPGDRRAQRSKSVKTINSLNVHFEVGAGGFAGATNPSFVYTVIDSGPNAATHEDVRIVTDSLGYVLSQGSAFLLDAAEHGELRLSGQLRRVELRHPSTIEEVCRALRNRRTNRPGIVRDR